ncbi:MAG: hypothetical protein IJD10_02550, partial [Clostridia bacterium]|nr:hypothetical protein [Clostridia bacterium]
MKRLRILWIALIAFLLTLLVSHTALAAEVLITGQCGEASTYTLFTDGRLVVDGSGSISCSAPGTMPWSPYAASVTELVLS